jgi:hypothetical protein
LLPQGRGTLLRQGGLDEQCQAKKGDCHRKTRSGVHHEPPQDRWICEMHKQRQKPRSGSDKQWSVASGQWKRKKGTREEMSLQLTANSEEVISDWWKEGKGQGFSVQAGNSRQNNNFTLRRCRPEGRKAFNITD